MINNQVQQINTLTQQLQQIQSYVKAFGDPSKLLQITGADSLVSSLKSSGVGQTIGQLQQAGSGVAALKYYAKGLYESLGTKVQRRCLPACSTNADAAIRRSDIRSAMRMRHGCPCEVRRATSVTKPYVARATASWRGRSSWPIRRRCWPGRITEIDRRFRKSADSLG